MRLTRVMAVVVAGGALALTGCAATVTPTTAPAPSSASSGPATSPAPKVAGIGSAYQVDDGTGDTYKVTLTGVTDRAKGADAYTVPDKGKRFVAVRFTLTGVSGTATDDANTTASLVGSDQQTYTADFADVRGCTNFQAGLFNLTAGRTSVGCVVFQLPSAVKVASVQWTASLIGGAVAEWHV